MISPIPTLTWALETELTLAAAILGASGVSK
jgi:hypothetical protein